MKNTLTGKDLKRFGRIMSQITGATDVCRSCGLELEETLLEENKYWYCKVCNLYTTYTKHDE